MESKRSTPAHFYVYHLVDPRNNEVFYVGKGKGNRIANHEREARGFNFTNPVKTERIKAIWADSQTVIRLKVSEGLTEREALALERREIKRLRPLLSNFSSGSYSDVERAATLAHNALCRMRSFNDWWAWCTPEYRESVGGFNGMHAVYAEHQLFLTEIAGL